MTLLAAGDRLHFGLAVEQAKAEGLKVDMLVVGDDCALASKHLVGRRGVAGTVLVLKASWCPCGYLFARLCGDCGCTCRDAQASLVQHSLQADLLLPMWVRFRQDNAAVPAEMLRHRWHSTRQGKLTCVVGLLGGLQLFVPGWSGRAGSALVLRVQVWSQQGAADALSSMAAHIEASL